VEETNATLGNGGESFRRLRLRNGRAEHPVRVIVSGSGSFSTEARIWSHRFSPIHVWTGPTVTAARRQALQSCADVVWTSPTDPIDLAAGLAQMAQAHAISDGTGIEHLTEAPGFTLKSLRRHGDEVFLVYSRGTSLPT
jgi:riboflavin biosynthesis pyrimidine reductase